MRGRGAGGEAGIGPDRVVVLDDGLTIDAASENPGWEPRRYRRLAILFEGRRYFVAAREHGGRGRVRYRLEAWPEESAEDPVLEIRYDREYVEIREANRRRAASASRLDPLVSALSPLIGLLPAGTKLRLEERYGIGAVIATERSLWLEYMIFLLASVLLAISVWTGGVTGLPLVGPRQLVVTLFVLGPDGIVRYSKLKEGIDRPWGFYEWLPHALSRRR